MNIVLVASRYLPHRGGLETVVHELAAQFKAVGHTVCIITNRYPRKLASKETIDGVKTYRLQFLFPRFTYVAQGKWRLLLGGMFYFPVTLSRLGALLIKERPDIINLHYVGNPSLFIWIICSLLRNHLVVSLHGGDVIDEPHKNKLNRWLFNAVVGQARHVTACSQSLLDQALSLAPRIERKSSVILNGVNAELFSSASPFMHPKPYICSVGQLEPHKGFDILISAFSRVSIEVPGFDLLIAGDGSQRDFLRNQAIRDRHSHEIQFMGLCSTQTVASLMRGSVGIVIPSRREAFGIVALEARAAGKPVVASKVGGLVEALASYDVTWFEPCDEGALQQALKEFLNSVGEGGVGRLQSKQTVTAGHSWHDVSGRYLEAFRAAS